MSDHLTAGERDVLTALTRAGLQGGHVTLDTLLVRNRMLLFSFSRASLARTLGALQRRCLTSKITTGGKAAYRIMPEGERVLAGKQQPAQAADAWAGQRFGTPAGEISRQWLDSGKLRTSAGWEPRVGLEEGLRRTIAWYREHLRHRGTGATVPQSGHAPADHPA